MIGERISTWTDSLDSRKVMEKVQKWIHEQLEKNPEIHERVKSIFEWLSKDLKNKIKNPEFYQNALSDYIDKTESTIKDLELSLITEKDPQKKSLIATSLYQSRLAYTKWLLNLTQLHAHESNNTALMLGIGNIRAEITVEESEIDKLTLEALKPYFKYHRRNRFES